MAVLKRALKPALGPFAVSIGDLQLPRREEDDVQPPLLRFYYPSAGTKASMSASHSCADARWLPKVAYAFGFLSNSVKPYTSARRAIVWILAWIMYVVIYPTSALSCFLAKPLLPEEEAEKDKLPVVIFSHGLWACRTTYSALCCDLASHGYIVVAPEHLDGSANAGCYIDNQGKDRLLHHRFADPECHFLSLEERGEQLKQRIKEINLVVEALETLDKGELPSGLNLVKGRMALDTSTFHGRIDTDRVVIAGHSFGGATAIVASKNSRFVCCLGMDVWWEPIEKADYQIVHSKVPAMLLNTEKFDWKALREARLVFLNARASAGEDVVTKFGTIKGTCHQDQSDLPLIMPTLCKKLGLSGSLDPQLAKDINSRACLIFLQQHLTRPGMRFPCNVEPQDIDSDHIVFSDV